MICTYDRTIYENCNNGYRIVSYTTDDESVPENARGRYRSDRRIQFTATGYHIPNTTAVNAELTGKWETGKYGMQLTVTGFHEIVPKTTTGILAIFRRDSSKASDRLRQNQSLTNSA